MLYLYTQDETGEEKVTLFSMHTHTHTRTDRCEQNTDAHTHTGSHTPQGPWPPFHGCLSHILSFCLVSLPAKRRKEDGQGTEREKNKAAVFSFVFFFLFFSWLQSEDVNEPEEDKKKKDDKTMDVFWEIRVLTGWDVTPESKTLSGSRAVDLKLRKLKDS